MADLDGLTLFELNNDLDDVGAGDFPALETLLLWRVVSGFEKYVGKRTSLRRLGIGAPDSIDDYDGEPPLTAATVAAMVAGSADTLAEVEIRSPTFGDELAVALVAACPALERLVICGPTATTPDGRAALAVDVVVVDTVPVRSPLAFAE